jgi:hypothetical protein
MITRTKFSSPAYDGAIKPLLSYLGKDVEPYREAKAEGLTVLRATVMNPFAAGANPDYLHGPTDEVRRIVEHWLGADHDAAQKIHKAGVSPRRSIRTP